jgi:hypothetical protein
LPAYAFIACWYVLVVAAFLLLGIETKGRSLEAIEVELNTQAGPGRSAVDAR